jgi:hypothetical protein
MDRYVMKEKRLPKPHRRAIRLLYAQSLLLSPVEKYFGGLQEIVLESGFVMVKKAVEPGPEDDGRRKFAWHVSPQKWK